MTSITVRRFASSEWATYRALRLNALSDSPDAFCSTLTRESAWPDSLWSERIEAGARSDQDLPLIAEVDDNAVGLAWGKFDADDPRLVHVFQMWVDPSHRGRGIGRLLLARIIEWARATGATGAILGVSSANSPARHLYDRMGFLPNGPLESLRPDSDLQVQMMVLDLANSSEAGQHESMTR